MKTIFFRTFFLFLFLLTLPFAHAAKKALVIGNSKYENDLNTLQNPTKDASIIADALRDIGFSVQFEKDLDYRKFDDVTLNFAQSLQPDDTVFFYYAGHGVAVDGQNYLLPVAPKIGMASRLNTHAINAEGLVNMFTENHANAVLVFDACRNNPFTNSRAGGKRGLEPMRQRGGRSSYIFYAAQYGEEALDDGTFARTLAAELRKPQSIEDIRAQVAQIISRHTHGKQNPYGNSNLKISAGRFFLANPQQAAAQIPPAPQPSEDLQVLTDQAKSYYDQKDYDKARPLLEKAAAQGYARAQVGLGVLYYFGRGVTQDYGKAKMWYEKAAAQGYANAQFDLGMLYKNGHGVTQDYGKAKMWFEKAAAQGYADAQFYLGKLYENGDGVTQDYDKAKMWYEKAAAQGDAYAQFYLGVLYHFGLGVTQDYGKAKMWWEKAAAQGLAEAQNNLSILKRQGY